MNQKNSNLQYYVGAKVLFNGKAGTIIAEEPVPKEWIGVVISYKMIDLNQNSKIIVDWR